MFFASHVAGVVARPHEGLGIHIKPQLGTGHDLPHMLALVGGVPAGRPDLILFHISLVAASAGMRRELCASVGVGVGSLQEYGLQVEARRLGRARPFVRGRAAIPPRPGKTVGAPERAAPGLLVDAVLVGLQARGVE